MKLYKIGETDCYPCGCVWQKTEDGFIHFVNPECKNDSGKTSKLDSYRYMPWTPEPFIVTV